MMEKHNLKEKSQVVSFMGKSFRRENIRNSWRILKDSEDTIKSVVLSHLVQ